MPRTTSEKPVRLNLEMPTGVHEKLQSLRERTDALSQAEVIRKALAIYDLIVTNRELGGELIVRDADGHEKTVIII